MKTSFKITVCGIFSALAVVIMLLSELPVFLYAIPVVASLVFIIPAVELGTKWALLCYGVSSVLTLLLPSEREAAIVFIGILGYYPILKMVLERLGLAKPVLYIIKLAVFNIATVISYVIIIRIMGVSGFENEYASVKVTEAALLLLGNIVFVIYDAGITRIIRLYFIKFRKSIRTALKLK